MYSTLKAGASNRSGKRTADRFADNQKRFSGTHYKYQSKETQCSGCGSDFMRHSVEGYCQMCQQRVEFILRERPIILAKSANRQGGKS